MLLPNAIGKKVLAGVKKVLCTTDTTKKIKYSVLHLTEALRNNSNSIAILLIKFSDPN